MDVGELRQDVQDLIRLLEERLPPSPKDEEVVGEKCFCFQSIDGTQNRALWLTMKMNDFWLEITVLYIFDYTPLKLQGTQRHARLTLNENDLYTIVIFNRISVANGENDDLMS